MEVKETLMALVNVTLRILTIMPLFLLVAILLGKRHLAELSVFDFVVAITLGAVAGADIADPKIEHLPTVFSIVALGALHVMLSATILRKRSIGRWLTLDPTLVIQKGIILKENLQRIRYTVDDLVADLRSKGVFNLSEVEYAVLEPTGNLSVLRRPDEKPITPKDVGKSPSTTGLPLPVILEGKVHLPGLQTFNLTEAMLLSAIQKFGYSSVEDIFIAMVNAQAELYISPVDLPLPMERIDH